MVAGIGALVKTLTAYLFYPFCGARTVGHLMGIVPYVPFFSARFDRELFVPPAPFIDLTHDPWPSTFWDRPKPSSISRHQIVKIHMGQADQAGSVFDCKGRPVAEACHPLRQRWKYRWRSVRDGIRVDYMKRQAQPRSYPGRIGVLTSSNQHIYAHWLLDILPRIAKLQEQHHRVAFYFLQHVHSFQRETLQCLNVDEQVRIINCAEVPWVSGDELVVPCHQIMFGYHHPRWACQWLRERFLPTGNVSGRQKRKVYLSRSMAARRKIINEQEIGSFLCHEGFEFCVLEQLSFVEQVRLFQEAEIVVSPHGSGLANLVFCSPGTKVLELFPARATDAYFRLCVDMNLTYRCLKTREHSPRPRVSDNFSINIDDVKEALDDMCA
ncbi:MAG: hypothetical protein NPIRA02_06490 [Nitrospirales bacterium]|nr:MAG: hypothetical protein NPIRA02_06490 [Nitrospirales bacterium]